MRHIDMQCSAVKQNLAHLVDNGVFLSEQSAEYQHLQRCDECCYYWEDLQLNKQLHSLEVPPMPNGFVDQVIAGAVASGSKLSLRKTLNYWAMAAVLLLGVLLGLAIGDRASMPTLSGQESAGVELIVNRTRPVNVIIDSDVDISEAVISIVLADNMEIEGYPDIHELSWTAELRKGKNLLKLPLRIRDTGVGYLEVAYSDGHSKHRVRIDVSGRLPVLNGSGEESPNA